MTIANRTAQQKLDLANALDRAAADVRKNVAAKPVNYVADVDASLAAAKTVLDATVAAT